MSKGKIDKNSSFFKNLENIYANKAGVKKPHKEIKKAVEVPQPIQQIPQQIIQQVPQQIQVPQPVFQSNNIPPQNIIINVLGNNQNQILNNHYVKCPNCQYTFVNNTNNPFLQYMK